MERTVNKQSLLIKLLFVIALPIILFFLCSSVTKAGTYNTFYIYVHSGDAGDNYHLHKYEWYDSTLSTHQESYKQYVAECGWNPACTAYHMQKNKVAQDANNLTLDWVASEGRYKEYGDFADSTPYFLLDLSGLSKTGYHIKSVYRDAEDMVSYKIDDTHYMIDGGMFVGNWLTTWDGENYNGTARANGSKIHYYVKWEKDRYINITGDKGLSTVYTTYNNKTETGTWNSEYNPQKSEDYIWMSVKYPDDITVTVNAYCKEGYHFTQCEHNHYKTDEIVTSSACADKSAFETTFDITKDRYVTFRTAPNSYTQTVNIYWQNPDGSYPDNPVVKTKDVLYEDKFNPVSLVVIPEKDEYIWQILIKTLTKENIIDIIVRRFSYNQSCKENHFQISSCRFGRDSNI